MPEADLPALARVAHRQRFAETIGGMAAHDLRNSAQLIQMTEEALRAVPGVPQSLCLALSTAARKLLEQVVWLHRAPLTGARRAPIVLADLVESAVSLTTRARSPVRLHAEIEVPRTLRPAFAVEEDLLEALWALLTHLRDVGQKRAMATVVVRGGDDGEGGLRLELFDRERTISLEGWEELVHHDHLDSERPDLGLGVARTLIEHAGGHLYVEAGAADDGSPRLVVTLPAWESSARPIG